MNTYYKIIFAFLIGIFIRLFTNPWILGYNHKDFSIHINKIYDAIFFGCIIAIIQIFITIDTLTNPEKICWIMLFLTMLSISMNLINNQKFVNDKQLLLKLKENYAESNRLAEILVNNNSLGIETRNFILDHLTLKKDAILTIDNIIKSIQ